MNEIIARKTASIGSRPVRSDGVPEVTGAARHDNDHHPPGVLCGRVLRSPRAHARILRIDTHCAGVLPGVHAVVTAHLRTSSQGHFPDARPDGQTGRDRGVSGARPMPISSRRR